MFKYRILNGAIEISGYMGEDQLLNIPSEIEGLPVTSIGQSAFENNPFIRRIELPQSVTQVKAYAFRFCKELYSINMDHLKKIDMEAFRATKMIDITLPEDVETISRGIFAHCHRLYSFSFSPFPFDWDSVLEGTRINEVHFRGTKAEYDLCVTGIPVGSPAFFFLDCYGREYRYVERIGKTPEFEYSVLSGGGIRIDKINPSLSVVVLPDYLEDEDQYITEIAYGAFPPFARKVYIPFSVRNAKDAFAFCMGALQHISIPYDLSIEPATIPKDAIVEYRWS